MLMLGKDVIDKKIVHVNNDEEKADVKDILISEKLKILSSKNARRKSSDSNYLKGYGKRS